MAPQEVMIWLCGDLFALRYRSLKYVVGHAKHYKWFVNANSVSRANFSTYFHGIKHGEPS